MGTAVGAYTFGAAGTVIGAAVLGPVGAVLGNAVGVHVGGFLGGVVGDWVAGQIMEQKTYKDFKENAVQWMADKIDEGGEVIKKGYNDIKNNLSDQVNRIDNTIKNYAKDFLSRFGIQFAT
jgi:phage tail tape-measure protein